MSWRKKIGWRGPLRDPVSEMTEAAIESAGGFDGCAWDGAPPKVSSAASAPAPTPPTTKANVRIIDLTLREALADTREIIHLLARSHDGPGPSGRRSIFGASYYTTRPRYHSDVFTRDRPPHLRRAAAAGAEGRDAAPAAPRATRPSGPQAEESHPPPGAHRAPSSTT